MPFDGSTINRLFRMNDDDSEEFKALYREPNYEKILEELTNRRHHGQGTPTRRLCPSRGQGLQR